MKRTVYISQLRVGNGCGVYGPARATASGTEQAMLDDVADWLFEDEEPSDELIALLEAGGRENIEKALNLAIDEDIISDWMLDEQEVTFDA